MKCPVCQVDVEKLLKELSDTKHKLIDANDRLIASLKDRNALLEKIALLEADRCTGEG